MCQLKFEELTRLVKSNDSFQLYINIPFEQIKESLGEHFVKASASYFICFRHGNDLKILNKKITEWMSELSYPGDGEILQPVKLPVLAYCDNAIKSGWLDRVFQGLAGLLPRSSPASTRKILSFQSLILGSTFYFKYSLYIFQRGRLEIPY